jgi:hypothetical protein
MYKTIIVDPENLWRCLEILNIPNAPDRWVDEPTWLTWDPNGTYKSILPHSVFRANFVVIGHSEDSMIAERL